MRMKKRFALNMKIDVVADWFDLSERSFNLLQCHGVVWAVMLDTKTAIEIADVCDFKIDAL